jgi:hypothetical protein
MLSKRALKLRRLVRVYEGYVSHWASVDEASNPWWRRNVYLYQNRMMKAESERSALLRAYLSNREIRS